MSYMHNQFDPKKHSKFNPMNPEKYKGDINKIISRSSYEWNFYRWLDSNDNVILWVTEPVGIPYIDYTGKMRNYFPDVVFQCKSQAGDLKTYMVEIKPYKETIEPKPTKRKQKKTILYEQKTWETNKRKWLSARKYCEVKGWIFKLITERELFN